MTAALALIFIGSPDALVVGRILRGHGRMDEAGRRPLRRSVDTGLPCMAAPSLVASVGGSGAPVAPGAWFTLWIAPPGIFAPRPWAAEMAFLTDPNRYAIIGRAVVDHLPGYPLILLALLAVTLRIERDRQRAAAVWTAATALFLMLASYLAAYLVTPLDLNWHIANSMDRLIVQIWPAMLLTLCALLPPDLDPPVRHAFAEPQMGVGRRGGLSSRLLLYRFHPPLATPLPPELPKIT